MPIRAYLDGLRFDPEAIRLMGIAFEMALVALQRTDGIVNPTRDAFHAFGCNRWVCNAPGVCPPGYVNVGGICLRWPPRRR